jgi:hypothetical protein
MKVKKLLIIAVVVSTAILFNSPACAEFGWFFCTVDQIGVSTRLEVQLTTIHGQGNPSEFSKKWFELSPNPDVQQHLNRFLATILTAISTGATIQVGLDPAEKKSIYGLYIAAK